MAIQFKTFPKGSLIGSGAYKFRHYGQEKPWLCFTAQQAGSRISMAVNGTLSKGQAFETSFDGITWEVYTPGTTIALANIGDKVYFRGDNETVSESTKNYYKYVMSGKISASGNIMSLLDKTCSTVNVPAYCYYNMFNGCTALTTPPELPATTLANYCYASMFQSCTGIKLSTTQTSYYKKPYRIPSSGTGQAGTGSLAGMFYDTGGTFNGTPAINTTYYLA